MEAEPGIPQFKITGRENPGQTGYVGFSVNASVDTKTRNNRSDLDFPWCIITTGHFLLGFMREETLTATSILIDVLKKNGVGRDKARDHVIRILNEEPL